MDTFQGKTRVVDKAGWATSDLGVSVFVVEILIGCCSLCVSCYIMVWIRWHPAMTKTEVAWQLAMAMLEWVGG